MCSISKFFPDLSHMMKPLREKLKKSIDYTFGDIEQKEFDHVKEPITNRMPLVAYDPTRRTRIIHVRPG